MIRFSITSILIFICAFAADVSAATAKINKVWIEHGTQINNRDVMKVHCDFNVTDMEGKKGSMAIWIKNESGKWHTVNSQFKSDTGVTYFNWQYESPYYESHFTDLWYAPYIDDLLLLAGENEYTVVVTINDENGKILAQSDGVTFVGTGASNSYYNNDYNDYNNSYNNSYDNNYNNRSALDEFTNTWREELGYGGFVIVREFPNGAQQRVRYRLCPNCYGSQICQSCHGSCKCSICGGKGGIISAGYGNYYPCAMCYSTGLCTLCKGTGRCACTSELNEYPGYAIGSTTFMAADGTILDSSKASYNDFDSDNSSSSGNSYRSNSSGSCPDCGGTRLWRQGKSPEYARPRSELVGYYNASGNECPYCGYHSEHWHSKCTTCKH